ncbi:MAG TPA: hypothetical protein V6D00_00425 [Pantanalinema sp.]
MEARETQAAHALRQVKALQDQGRSFESIAAVLTAIPLEAHDDERALLRAELERERAARHATDRVLADRCKELMALRESYDFARETIRVLESRLSRHESEARTKASLAPRSSWLKWR